MKNELKNFLNWKKEKKKITAEDKLKQVVELVEFMMKSRALKSQKYYPTLIVRKSYQQILDKAK